MNKNFNNNNKVIKHITKTSSINPKSKTNTKTTSNVTTSPGQRVQKRGVRMTKNGRYRSRAERGPFIKYKVKRFKMVRFFYKLTKSRIKALKRLNLKVQKNSVNIYYYYCRE